MAYNERDKNEEGIQEKLVQVNRVAKGRKGRQNLRLHSVDSCG